MHDSHAPCFHADSEVRMVDGSTKRLGDLRRGDRVATGCTVRPAATVRCLVSTPCPDGVAKLVALPGSGLLATPWHPVRPAPGSAEASAEDEPWVFPTDLAPAMTVPCEFVCSFVLEGAEALQIEGWQCLAWGHGVQDDAVASHDFFGTEAVISSLSKLAGWRQGRVELQGLVRDPSTGLVCELRVASSVPLEAQARQFRGRMPCDADAMQSLHEHTGWTPGAAHVRPDASMLVQKEVFCANLAQQWASPADWVFHTVFGMEAARQGGLRTAARPPPGLVRLVPQQFPYSLPAGTVHLVLWCSSPHADMTDEAITAAIASAVDTQGGGAFVWYENPKPSIVDPQLSHVQVFWTGPADRIPLSHHLLQLCTGSECSDRKSVV